MTMRDAPTIWGIHAGKTGDAHRLFLSLGYIALGWHQIDDLTRLAPNRDAFKAAVSAAYPYYKPGAIPVAAGQLFRFVHVARPGDLVVYRSKQDKLIRLGQITGDYRFNPALEPGYPHLRPAEWLAEVRPNAVTQGALYEIGSAMSFFQVRNYAEEWLQHLEPKTWLAADDIDHTVEPEDDPTVAYVAESIEENTRDFIIKQFETELKGHPFARFVAHLLQTMGYQTRVSPEGADGGVDIVAHRDELGFEPPIIKVQVKSGSGNVGQPEVSSLLGALSAGENGLVITLSSYTTQARTFARNKGNLRLIDGDDLVDLTLRHYDQLDSRYKGMLPLKRVYVPEPIDT
jgi:restriction system protein